MVQQSAVQRTPVIDLDTERKEESACRSAVPADRESTSSESTSGTGQVRENSEKQFEYSVKVVPPDRKGGYQVHKLRACLGKMFTSVEEVKSQLQKYLKEHISDSSDMKFGYIEPGKQGIRGKMRWIFTADDIKDMYAVYGQKTQTEIILWCDGQRTTKVDDAPLSKRAHTESSKKTCKKTCITVSQRERLDKVQEIYETLRSKHENYNQERLRMWAHLIQMGKHESYDVPPNQPFFKEPRSQKKDTISGTKSTESAQDPQTSVPGTCISPVKRSNLRSAYMTQVKEWHNLFKDGAITDEEYEEQKKKILGDLGDL